MTEETHDSVKKLIQKLKQERDELALQMHLGKEELKDEWDAVQHRLDQLVHRFEPLNQAVAETSEDVWASLKLVGEEVWAGFQRIRKSI